MKECEIAVGSVVLSKQGRDKGNYFVVVATGKDVVFVADGGARKLASPKKEKHQTRFLQWHHSGRDSNQTLGRTKGVRQRSKKCFKATKTVTGDTVCQKTM